MSENVSKDFEHWLGIVGLERAIVAIVSNAKEAENLVSPVSTLCILESFQEGLKSIRPLVPLQPFSDQVHNVLVLCIVYSVENLHALLLQVKFEYNSNAHQVQELFEAPYIIPNTDFQVSWEYEFLDDPKSFPIGIGPDPSAKLLNAAVRP